MIEPQRKGESRDGGNHCIRRVARPRRDERQALTAYLAEIRRRIAALDEREPENMSSEAYDEWSEEHEQLEQSRTIFSTG